MTTEQTSTDATTIRVAAGRPARLINPELGFLLGWNDVYHRYRRSRLGQFWVTLSMAVLIITLGVIFSALFNIPLATFLPFVTLGLIFWTYISTSLNEGCTTFIEAEHLILQVRIPLFTHTLRVWWRNTIILAHNLIIFPIVLLLFQIPPTWEMLLVIPGALLLVANVFWLMFVLGLLCARYRDITLIVQNILQVLFYATPIMWMPQILEGNTLADFIFINPLFHLIEIVRAPLMGEVPGLTSYVASALAAVLGWAIALSSFRQYRRQLPYWL